MIKIEPNSINFVYVNCSRNKSLSNPTYLFSIVNQYSGLTKRFIPENVSFTANTQIDYLRYDKFKFNVSGSTAENFIYSAGTDVNLHLESGMYYYKIYEQLSNTNLNPSLSYDVLDEGILFVNGIDTPTPNYTGYSNNNIAVYTGG